MILEVITILSALLSTGSLTGNYFLWKAVKETKAAKPSALDQSVQTPTPKTPDESPAPVFTPPAEPVLHRPHCNSCGHKVWKFTRDADGYVKCTDCQRKEAH